MNGPVICAGGSASASLRISGGTPPYQHRIIDDSAGVTLELAPGSDPEQAWVLHVLGAQTAGQLLLEVQDSTGKVVQSDPIVARERPSVATLELPVACAGLGYGAPLFAEGGEGSYQWSATLLDQAQSLGDLGLRVSGSSIAGELGGSLGSHRLSVSVWDSQCESVPVVLSLAIVPEQSDECPAIVLEQAPDELPPACLGSAYAETLVAEGGEPPYTWAALELPPGLELDAESATLSGVAEGPGQVRVSLGDALGRSVERAYPLATRDRCWLGYIAAERQPARLELVDPLLLERQPELARRQLPGAASGGSALDFRFAPSGRWLAYRLARGTERALELVRVSDARTHTLDAISTTDAYAFARDSSALAVSFTRGGQTFLGGVELSGAEPVVFAPGSELSGLRSLAPRAAPAVASPLFWYEQRLLAYLSPDGVVPGRRRLVTALLAADGFAPPVVHTEQDFSAGATLLESAAGVFVMDPDTALTTFIPAASGAARVVAAGAFAAPSGALVARAQEGALQVWPALEAGSPTPATSASGCSALLAWSAERELIACADERSSPGALTLWQAQPAPVALLSLGPRRDADVIASSTFGGLRRTFSPGGSWLAVGADDALYVARPEPAARLAFSVPSSALGLRAGVLAFSPDERALLAGAANTLAWLDLTQGAASFQVLSVSALLEEGCSEELLAGYGAWCGSPSSAPNVSWSSSSDQVAFRSVLGTLQVVDVSRARDGGIGSPRSPDRECSEACSSASNARFQP